MDKYTQEEIEQMEAEHQLEMERWWWINQES